MWSASLWGSEIEKGRSSTPRLQLITRSLVVLLLVSPCVHVRQVASQEPASRGHELLRPPSGAPLKPVLVGNNPHARWGDPARLREAPPRPPISEAFRRLPLSFEANRGQVDDQVKFLSRGNGYVLFLTSTEAAIQLRTGASPWSVVPGPSQPTTGDEQRTTDDSAILRMKLVGANPDSQLAGLEELPGKVNYLIGSDPTRWRTNIPVYARVKIKDVYPGVDMIYYGNQQELEYDFIVAAGADPAAIKLAFAGARSLRLDGRGDLVVTTAMGQVRLSRPRIFQDGGSQRREIAGGYVLAQNGTGEVSFQLADYDTSQPLIIDPVLSYSTFLGGSFIETGGGIAVDADGNAYVVGHSISFDFPTKNPLQPKRSGSGNDVFLAKLDPTGSQLLFSTYLGGTRDEMSGDIAVDKAGNVYLTGATLSDDFPTENPIQPHLSGQYDAFVVALNTAGSEMIYSTYLGGRLDDAGIDIALDAADNAYVAGETRSLDFRTSAVAVDNKCGTDGLCDGNVYDAFVAKLDRLGTKLVYSTFLGGRSDDRGLGVAVDGRGNAYVTGTTSSIDFPTLNAFQATFLGVRDVYVAKINSRGSALMFATYLGGSDDDVSAAIAVDSLGSSYIVGRTRSLDFPRKSGVQRSYGGGDYDAFVTKLNTRGSALSYSTYLGGKGEDFATALALEAGSVYVVGGTRSANFPTKNPLQMKLAGEVDVFVARLDGRGSTLVYSTYLGGSDEETATGIAVINGQAFVTGDVTSTQFPTANAVQPQPKGLRDAFVLKIAP